MSSTVRIKASQITKDWHVIDAGGRPLGRVASEAAILLRGKHKPTFEPHLDGGDFVIIVNASQVRLSGRKAEQMKYHRHSGFPGGLRTRTFTEQFGRFPARVVEEAVWGMLPKGPLGKAMARHLKVYPGPTHPHESQIVGSERAKAAREAALAETVALPMKAPRLRPLSVPQVVAGPVVREAKPAVPARTRKPVKVAAEAAVETPAAEAPAVESAAPEAAAPKRARRAAEAPATTTAETAPKARAPRKKAESAEVPVEAVPKPRATRRKAESAEAPVEAAPKPHATRRKAESAEAAPGASAPEEKKPARRRAAAKTEE